MAQYQITVDQELLHRLFLGNNKDASVSALLESVLNQILQAQATEQLQAEPYERTDKRKGYRNGTRPHTLTTRVGTIALHVPRFRNGQFSTEMFARYQRSEQALILALMEMVINGVSTRKVSQITEELCGTEFSKSTVSELCKKLDPIVNAWNNRDLQERRYPFVFRSFPAKTRLAVRSNQSSGTRWLNPTWVVRGVILSPSQSRLMVR
jgi:putative transposase